MSDHISKNQLERYRERQLHGEELFSVNRHLGSCDECRTQYNRIANTDSSAVLQSMLHPHWLDDSFDSTAVSRLQPRFSRLSVALTVGMVAVVALTVALILRPSPSINHESQIVTGPAENNGTGPLPSPEISSTPLEVGTEVNQERTTTQATELRKPAELARVVRSEIVTLKGPSGEVAFSLLRPVGTFVLSTQPTLAWSPVKDATRYEVSMRPLNGTRSIFTTTTTETSYTPQSGALDAYRDQVLQWSVTAQLPNGGEVTAPGIAAPEALFVIANQARAREIEAQVRQQTNALTRATVFANASVLDDAERELASYLQKNPGDGNARRTLLTIKSWRGSN